MDPEFWKTRWAEGRIGFHEGTPNAFLVRHHVEKLATAPRVLVPLCGKAEDLAYLAAKGHEVVGVELIEDAVKAFFADHALDAEVTQVDGFVRYAAPSITIYVGDIFATTRTLLGPVDAIWDRAALIALPDDDRRRYVDHLRGLVPKGGRFLLVTLEYPPGSAEGPPFSVEEAEVRVLFDNCDVEVLGEGPDPRGRADTRERCYAITL